MMILEFVDLLKKENIELTEEMLQKLEMYFEELVEVNKVMNLTAITEKNEVYIKHFYDSLCIVKAHNFTNETLLDVGSGAGFPGIPLKIVFPNIKLTIVDSLQKRIKFLESLTKKLDLKNVTLIHSRIEDYKEKNSFDIVTARAVSRLNILTEFCLPFVKVNGKFVALKGSQISEELEEGKSAINTLGGKLEKVIEYNIPGGERNLVVVKKVKNTSKDYPRPFAKIKTKPL